MTATWLPGFARVDLDGAPRGGPYDDLTRPKLGWHTWEGLSWSAAEASFRPYPPHLAVFPPWPGHEKQVAKRQYVPLDRHAYAFAGSENDDEYVVQVEVAGFAKDMRTAPDVVLRWLAVEVVAPIEAAIGLPRTALRFYDETDYPGKAPNYMASARSVIRLSPAELRQYSGHLGHQHMPAPDKHWDPGCLPLDRILGFLAPTIDQEVDENMIGFVLDCYELYLRIGRAQVVADEKLRQDVSYHAWQLTSGATSPEQKRADIEKWARAAKLYPQVA